MAHSKATDPKEEKIKEIAIETLKKLEEDQFIQSTNGNLKPINGLLRKKSIFRIINFVFFRIIKFNAMQSSRFIMKHICVYLYCAFDLFSTLVILF